MSKFSEPKLSSMPSTGSQEQSNVSSASTQASMGCLGSVFVLIFRTILLLGGSGLALIVGGAIATVYPADVAEPPVLETVLQHIDDIRP